jgi:hypothetical protein
LAKICTDILSDGASDVLSGSDSGGCDDDDDVNNENYSDFKPEIARKMKETVRNLSSESESGSAE